MSSWKKCPFFSQVSGSYLKLASEYERPSSLNFNFPAILIVSFKVQKSSWATSALITCQLSFLQKNPAKLFLRFKIIPSETPAWHLRLHSRKRSLISAFKKCVVKAIFSFVLFFEKYNNKVQTLKFSSPFPWPVSLCPSLLITGGFMTQPNAGWSHLKILN